MKEVKENHPQMKPTHHPLRASDEINKFKMQVAVRKNAIESGLEESSSKATAFIPLDEVWPSLLCRMHTYANRNP